MHFIELTPFQTFRATAMDDESFRELQNFLLEQPDAGDVIKGSGGLRKLRWSGSGRGKRGGSRIVYYWFSADDTIALIFGYAKNAQDDLTPAQLKQLSNLMKDLAL